MATSDGAPASWQIREGDCRDVLRSLSAQSVHTVVTSPPYFGLRDYGAEGQIGLEPTPDEFVAALVEVFREVRRVLRDDGTVWLNLGDSYASSPPGIKSAARYAASTLKLGPKDAEARPDKLDTSRLPGTKPKDLLGVPWMVAFALRADGWYLRSDIVWAKPNPMPESVTDRPTKSHEFVFLLSKRPSYFYDSDAIREPDAGTDHDHRNVLDGQPSLEPSNGLRSTHGGLRTVEGRNGSGRNKRSVWTVATQPYSGAHFATFPPKLIEPCVLAGAPERACGVCGAPWVRVVERQALPVRPNFDGQRGTLPKSRGRENGGGDAIDRAGNTSVRTLGFEPSCHHQDDTGHGVILDPFAGAGTTGLVALRHNRSFIGIELNPEYAEMARCRIRDDSPLFNTFSEIAA